MISLVCETENATFVHLIQGRETQVWKDLHGRAVVNFTEVLKRVDTDKPMALVLTECDSEDETAKRLMEVAEYTDISYPFTPPSAFFSFTQESVADKKVVSKDVQADGTVYDTGVCASCGHNGNLVKGVPIKVCPSCVVIDISNARKGGRNEESTGGT